MNWLYWSRNLKGGCFTLLIVNLFMAAPAYADADSDWIVRSTAPGVYTAVGFDNENEVAQWTFPDSTADHVSWEQTLSASGNGSLRFDVLKNDGPASGSWVHWLADDQREFTTGDEFYVQFRQYMPAYFATHKYLNGNGFKQTIISRRGNVMGGVNVPQPYGSNQLNEIVLQNSSNWSILQGYNRDSDGQYRGWDKAAVTRCSSTDFISQNGIDRGVNPLSGLSPDNDPWTACEQDRARYGGLYSFYSFQPDGYVPGSPDPIGGAFNYFPDEWLTFYLRIRLGVYGGDSHDSHITLWAAREGDEDYTLVIDRDNLDLGNGPNHDAIWLLPYTTGRSGDPTRQDTFTLYDELIVSANPIPVPTAGLTFSFIATPSTIESGGEVELTWSGNAANSCVAAGDWSGSKPASGSQVVGPVFEDSNFILGCTGPGGSSTRSTQVTVTPMDNVAPTISAVAASGAPDAVKITFSEAVEAASVAEASNYSISGGVSVVSAAPDANSDDVVLLNTSMLSEYASYTLTVSNVTDQSNGQNAIADNSQANFVYYPSLAGTDTSPSSYQWSTLQVGQLVYVDRSYSYLVVPEQYEGLDYLITANGDKDSTDPDFLSFDLPSAATLLVGHDKRISPKPDWLSGWTANGDEIQTTDTEFDLYERAFPAGRVTLGGNAGGGRSMYFVVVAPSAPVLDSQPAANDDGTSTSQNADVTVDVLANDSGLADKPITVTVQSQPANGTASATNNQILYSPDNGFEGTDTVGYRVTDADGDTSVALLTVTVVAPGGDFQPSLLNDAANTSTGVPVNIDVLANDSGIDDLPLSLVVTTLPANGETTIESDNTISYQPDRGFEGGDSFVYRVTDVDGDEDTATVTLVISSEPVDAQPEAIDDAVQTLVDVPITIPVLANDDGLQDAPVVLTISSSPANGLASVNSDLSITYAPTAGFIGLDSLRYRLTDADGDGAEAVVTISVREAVANSVPDARRDTVSTSENMSVTIEVLNNDIDVDEAPLTVAVVSSALHGETTVNGDQSIQYMPESGFTGADAFVYRVTDVDGDASEAAVTVTVSSVAPPATPAPTPTVPQAEQLPPADGGGGGGAAHPLLLLLLWAELWGFAGRRRR